MIKDIKNYWLNKSAQILFFEMSTYVFVGSLPLYLKLNTLALWIFALASITLSFKNKEWYSNLKNNKNPLSALCLLFALYLSGPLLSNDVYEAFNHIVKALPLFLLPLLVLSHRKEDFNIRNIYFSLGIGLFVGILICWYHIFISIMSKEKYMEQATYFFKWIYTDWNLVAPLEGHPSYFAVLIVIFLSAIITNDNFKAIRRNKYKFILLIFPFSIFLLETSSRIGVILLLVILFVHSIKTYRFKGLLLVIALIISIVMFSMKFDYLGSKFGKIISLEGEVKMERYHRWKEIFSVFDQEDKWLFGSGTGDAQNILQTANKNGNFDLAFKKNYNAHNQYLEFLIANGILGLAVYIFVLALFVYKTGLKQEALAFFMVFLLFSISESVFRRSQGVMIFSFLYPLLTLYYKPIKEHYG